MKPLFKTKVKIGFLLLCFSFSSVAKLENPHLQLSIISLNIYGWKTMPAHSNDYATLFNANKLDVIAIQEGVDDWNLKTKLPSDYSRAKTLKESLGKCWQHKFQIFINQCSKVAFVESGRFDLSDGPNATRTGEYAIITKASQKYLVVNIHWDHTSKTTRNANSTETSNFINKMPQYPTILLGDFNTQCSNTEVKRVLERTKMIMLKDAGIDCMIIKGLKGSAKKINAWPSDHPAIIARLKDIK